MLEMPLPSFSVPRNMQIVKVFSESTLSLMGKVLCHCGVASSPFSSNFLQVGVKRKESCGAYMRAKKKFAN